MIVLGIDGSTSQSSVCLGSDQGVLAAASLGRPQWHAEFLTPAIDFCLVHAGLEVDAIGGVAVTLGPGLYTGMRVALVTAQMFAHARGLPVIGRSTLDLLAFAYRHVRSDRVITAVLDARRGELFWARYRPVGDGVQRISEQRVGMPDKLAVELEATAEDTLCVGEGAVMHERLLTSTGAQVTAGRGEPSAVTLTELTLPAFLREDTQRPEDLRLAYLRQADATINWRKRGALRGGRAQAEGEAS